MNTRRLAKASFCEIFEGPHGPVHGIALKPQSLHHFVDLELSTRIIDDQPIVRFRLLLQSPFQDARVFQTGQQFGQGHVEHSSHLREVVKTDVFLPALDLAYVRSVQPAYMGKLLLRPLPGRTKLADPPAQKHQ